MCGQIYEFFVYEEFGKLLLSVQQRNCEEQTLEVKAANKGCPERPCFKTARGRLKGSFIRVGDADKPMTEYEVYSCESYRKRSRDDLRPVEGISSSALDQVQLERYLLKRKLDRPNFASVPAEQLYELTGPQKEGQFTP